MVGGIAGRVLVEAEYGLFKARKPGLGLGGVLGVDGLIQSRQIAPRAIGQINAPDHVLPEDRRTRRVRR